MWGKRMTAQTRFCTKCGYEITAERIDRLDARICALCNEAIGGRYDYLLKQLCSGEPIFRSDAARELAELGFVKEAIPILLDEVAHKQDRDVYVGKWEEKVVESEAEYAIACVIEAELTHEEEVMRVAAVEELAYLAPRHQQAIPPIIKALQDESPKVVFAAAKALNQLGQDISAAFPRLIEMLADRNYEIRYEAINALAELPLPDSALASILELLNYPDAMVRYQLIFEALERLVNTAYQFTLEDVATAVAAALKDESDLVRSTAADFFKNHIAGYEEILGPIFFDEDWHRRNNTPDLFQSRMRVFETVIIPALAEALKDEDGYVRGCAVETLGLIGPRAAVAVPGCIELLQDEESAARAKAAKALRLIDPRALE